MSWLEHLSEPLASTREEAARYIAEQLEQAVPEGWVVRYMGDHALAWTIAKVNIQPGEWPDKEYGVHLSRGLDSLSFTHGNKDNGPLMVAAGGALAVWCAVAFALVGRGASVCREI